MKDNQIVDKEPIASSIELDVKKSAPLPEEELSIKILRVKTGLKSGSLARCN